MFSSGLTTAFAETVHTTKPMTQLMLTPAPRHAVQSRVCHRKLDSEREEEAEGYLACTQPEG